MMHTTRLGNTIAWFASLAGLAAIAASSNAQVLTSQAQMTEFARDKAALEANPGLTVIPNSILVKFRHNTPALNANAALRSANATFTRTFSLVPGLTHARTNQPLDVALAALRANPWVEYAEPDFVQRPFATTPNDTSYNLQWGLHNTGQSIRNVTGVADADIDMPEAWDLIRNAPNTVIAVLDSGTQWSHPDLAANIWINPGEIAGNGIDDDGNGFIDDVRGWDFYQADNNPDDADGHGTHVAGTIGAVGNNGTGVVGVAWSARIMPLRFLGPNGGSTSDAIAAVNYAVMMGVKVSNNSWGGGGFSTALYNAISNAGANNHVFVAAAGNSGLNTDNSPAYPASYNLPNIISVAATDNRDNIASFSNFGVTTVDLGAPGVDIASTYTGSGYVWLSGTSMASPHVAGVVALLQTQNPTWSSSQVINRILTTTRPTAAMNGRTATGGVLNAFAALSGNGGGGGPVNTAPTVDIATPANNASFTQGASVSFSASASDAEDGALSASIIWTSSRDGAIGSGASFSTTSLSVGTHTVTASVTDSGNLTTTDTVTVVVNAPAGTAPAAPSNITTTNNRNRTATVRWSDNSNNETSFQIERQKQNRNGSWGSTTLLTAGANATSLVNNSGTGTFRYRVRARNASGDSAWTAYSQVTVTRR
jgi:large repetitive protein